MCTQTSPDRHSISVSARALAEAMQFALRAVSTLIVAMLTAPTRRLRNGRPRPGPINHVDVQILLDDRHCIGVLNQTLARTLRRAARIWAPLKLPVDRIVVGLAPDRIDDQQRRERQSQLRPDAARATNAATMAATM